MNVQEMLFQFFGGLGIFLFGLKYMGDGLQKSAGDNLRDILNTFTSTPFRAILAGVVVTVLIQSSSGTTVLTVGLVSAGFMSLKQAIGVIMGANIGTTITAFIIGFDIGAYALPIMAVGAFLLFFSKKVLINSIGQIIFGFGALFFGLELMGAGMEPFESMPQFQQLMLEFSQHPLLGVLGGAGLTLLVQSSSATIGILQELYANGSIMLEAALPVLFGNNIGTTITAVLAALGSSISARRTAASHVIFNLAGTVAVVLLLKPFTSLLVSITSLLNLNPEMQLAFAHGMFNVLNVLVQMWFINQIAYIVTKIIPGDDRLIDYEGSHLDKSIIHTAPSMALNQAKMEITQLGSIVLKEFQTMYSFYRNQEDKDFQDTMRIEEVVNEIDMQVTEYLMWISNEDLPVHSSQEHTSMMDITKYLERIGDHCENILKNTKDAVHIGKKNSKNQEETEKTFFDENLIALFDLVEQNISDSLQSFTENSYALADKVIQREQTVNELELSVRESYIKRMNEGIGLPSDGILFVDIVSNLERISDHTVKIAKHTLGLRYPFQAAQKNVSKQEQKEWEETAETANLSVKHYK